MVIFSILPRPLKPFPVIGGEVDSLRNRFGVGYVCMRDTLLNIVSNGKCSPVSGIGYGNQ